MSLITRLLLDLLVAKSQCCRLTAPVVKVAGHKHQHNHRTAVRALHQATYWEMHSVSFSQHWAVALLKGWWQCCLQLIDTTHTARIPLA